MAAEAHARNQLHQETTKVDHFHDLESQHGTSGAALARQVSVQLTAEQFERLYLQPGGQAAKGDLAKRFANPTPMGIASFLLCLTPFSALLMGWQGATTTDAATQVGAYYFIGGLGLFISGLLEWVLGNTFPATVFTTFGGFWFAFGFLLQPSQGIATALDGALGKEYNTGVAIYLIWWALLTFIYMIAALRTNVVFVLLFGFLEITFCLLIATFLRIGNQNFTNLASYLHAAGAFGFLTSLMGWYLLIVLIFGSTGIPLALPVGDLSNCEPDASLRLTRSRTEILDFAVMTRRAKQT
ncbi:uncharacterized protein P7C70_g2075, partial [Phenoliferia sp. Uapishka_3]